MLANGGKLASSTLMGLLMYDKPLHSSFSLWTVREPTWLKARRLSSISPFPMAFVNLAFTDLARTWRLCTVILPRAVRKHGQTELLFFSPHISHSSDVNTSSGTWSSSLTDWVCSVRRLTSKAPSCPSFSRFSMSSPPSFSPHNSGA